MMVSFYELTGQNMKLTWAAKNADELARTTTIVTNGDYIAEDTAVSFRNLIEHIDQAVCSTSSRE